MFTRRLVRSLNLSALSRLAKPDIRLVTTQSNTVSSESDWQPFRIESSTSLSSRQNASRMNMDKKRTQDVSHASKRRKIDKPSPFLPEGSNEEILSIEIAHLLSRASLQSLNGHPEGAQVNLDAAQTQPENVPEPARPFELQQEVELDIESLSSTGDGLAYNSTKDHVVVVPFSIPGDRVLAKIYRSVGDHSFADFVKVVNPSPRRVGVTPPCQYFAKCSGCQFQMLPYHDQLEHKRNIVTKAFQHFSGMKPEQIPEVEPTMGSPLQYGYRTKLTPHFTRPFSRKPREWDHVPNIGYNVKGRRDVMDIESCPIGTDIVREGLKIERRRVQEEIQSFKNGATILLRESTNRTYHQDNPSSDTNDSSNGIAITHQIPSNPNELDLQSSTLNHSPRPTITNVYPTHTDLKTYTSDGNAQATEYVTVTTDPTTTPPTTRTYKFTNTAGSFFQNNNSVLGPFTSYIYSQCMPQTSLSKTNSSPSNPIKFLLDAYSGSGLFTLTLSNLFTSSLGIDIDARSIAAARANAQANNLSTTTGFIDADAAALFADVPYPADQTLVVIDPPRKGCDRAFLKQLRTYGPRRIVYVSCNVHTQARDVGVMINGFTKKAKGVDGTTVDVVDEQWESSNDTQKKLARYTVEKIRGFDFFPQTGHVEGVCILNRVD